MNRLKLGILLFCLSSSIPYYAQTKDTLFARKNVVFNWNTQNMATTDQTYSFKKLDFKKNKPALVLYNNMTNMYDTYSSVSKNYMYNSSGVIFKNRSNFFTVLFLGKRSFMQSNSLMQSTYSSIMFEENSRYQVPDSFNPYGASNFGEALVSGFLGLLFD